MTSTPKGSSANSLGRISPRVFRNNRVGRALMVAGALVFVACIVWGLLIGGSAGTGAHGFEIDVIGSGGFALILAGAVMFGESRAFMRRNQDES